MNTVSTPKVEAFYWAAITFSQTLGTALGDWMADTGDLATRAERSYSPRGARRDCRTLLLDERIARAAVLGGLHSHPAVRRDRWRFPDKPMNQGGLALSRPLAQR